jgi:GDP-L-fucose synthase
MTLLILILYQPLLKKSKPRGVNRKVMDVSLAKKYGWKSKIKLNQSIIETYKSFKKENVN